MEPVDETLEPGPPPVPREGTLDVEADRASVAPARRTSRSGALRLLVVGLVAAALGFVAGLAASDVISVPDVLRSASVLEVERDAELVGLLEDIVRTEGVMLAFNDEVGERLAGVQEEADALAAIAEAAAAGADGLGALRPLIVGRSGGPRIADVRTVYLPHLDSWIDYLAALAEDPEMLFARDAQQPFLLLINATAEDFRDALEELLGSEPSARAAELAEQILDDGFRSEGPPPNI